MVLFMTNIENKNKEIRSVVASYAVCGNAAWTVTAGNVNRVQSVVTGHPTYSKAALVCTFYVPQTPCIATCNIANHLANIFRYGLCHVRLV